MQQTDIIPKVPCHALYLYGLVECSIRNIYIEMIRTTSPILHALIEATARLCMYARPQNLIGNGHKVKTPLSSQNVRQKPPFTTLPSNSLIIKSLRYLPRSFWYYITPKRVSHHLPSNNPSPQSLIPSFPLPPSSSLPLPQHPIKPKPLLTRIRQRNRWSRPITKSLPKRWYGNHHYRP